MYSAINDIQITCIVCMSFVLAGLFLLYRKSFNKPEEAFGYFLILNALFETIAIVSVSYFEIKNNLPGLHLYTLLEFVLLLRFAEASLNWLKGLPTNIIFGIGSLLIICNSLFIQSIYTYNSISTTSVKIFSITVSILFFYKILSSKKYSIVEVRPSVYFFTAIFLNACTSVTWYMYSNKLLRLSREQGLQLNIVKHSSAILASLIILTGIIYIIKRKENDII